MRNPMDLEVLSKSLLKEERLEEVIFQLSNVQESDFQERLSRRAPILQRCLKFLQAAASNRRYRYIPPILKFVLAANLLDDWLVSASKIILPKLNNLYCTILAEADPGSQQSPGKVNVAISSRVRRDTDAMRALSSVFDVCGGFCDLVDEENQQHLDVFLRTSAAVLFGSDFQKKRDTRNATDYAMDELARHSSYALSNIMLTFPGVVPVAEAILGKRLRCLFKFLQSSPEMSINRSLILMLRSLYERYEIDGESSKPRKDLIDEEFSYEGPGRRPVLCLFQKIDLASEDAAAQAENVSEKMHPGDNSEACFKSVKCSVQVKEQSNTSRYRVPFRCASIDWNRNSFVVHRPGDRPECWPLFLVSHFDWKKGRTELHLQIECSERNACRIVMRFNTQSTSEKKKSIIQDRLKEVTERIHSCDDRRPAFVTRKVSLADMKGTSPHATKEIAADFGCEEELSRERGTVTKGSKPSSEVGVKHILCTVAPHKVFSSGSHVADDSIGNITPSLSTESECMSSIDDKIEASPKRSISLGGSKRNRSSVRGSYEMRHSRESDHSSHGNDLGNDCDEQASQGQSEPSDVPLQIFKAGRFDMETDKGRNSCSQLKVTRQSVGKLVETELTERKMTVPTCKSKGVVNRLTEEDEQLRQKLNSVVARMLQWKRKQFSKVLQDTELSITSARERCEKQDHELLRLFANGVRKRGDLHTRKVANYAGVAKEVLFKTRKRLTSLREELMDGQRQLKILKTKSTTDITRAKDSMREGRECLIVILDQNVAATRRRGESRARKNSVLQSLAQLLRR